MAAMALKAVGAAGGLVALALLVYAGMWAGNIEARIERLEQAHAQPVLYSARDCPPATELVRRESDELVWCRSLGPGSPTAR